MEHLLYARHRAWIIALNLHINMIPILQMSKPRLKKVKKLAQDQRANKFCSSFIWREIWPTPEPIGFTTLP